MRRPLILAFCILLFADAAFGQSLKTGKKYVTAIVDPGQGWVTVRLFPGRPQDATLSFPQKSFVTFLVNGTYYTNNNIGLTPFPANASLLTDGVLSKVADTIRCVWPNKGGVDLIQEVYPVLLERSEQIVFRWKAVNKTSSSVTVSVQYLLDVEPSDASFGNDAAPILTRYGYRPIWDQFTRSTNFGIPWFYIAFQYKLPNSPTFNPGISGQGYLDNVNVNLGVTEPWRQTIGDWNQLIQHVWGPPSPLPSGTYADVATLLEFDPATALPNKEVQIARTSYGTGEFDICKGKIFAVVFYPLRLKWQPPNLVPNPFNVEMYAFNLQTAAGAPNTRISLTVGPSLRIIKPDTALTGGGKSQEQLTQGPGGPGNIPPNGMGQAIWTVQADKSNNCKDDILSSLKFYCTSPALGYPIFANEANGSDTCEHPIIIECSNDDILPPLVDKFVHVDPFTTTVGVHDDRPAADRGLMSISWKYQNGTDSTKFDVGYGPSILPCSTDKQVHTVTVLQRDSTVGGCIDLTFEDCAGNISDTTVCFLKHSVPLIPDTLAPLVWGDTLLTTTKGLFFTIDNRERDTGIASIVLTKSDFTTVDLVVSPAVVPCSRVTHMVTVQSRDSLKKGCVYLAVTDCAGNVAIDSLCFPGDTTLGIAYESAKGFSFVIVNNPAGKNTILRISLGERKNIKISVIDALGREVRQISSLALSAGISEVPLTTSDLAEGSYFVIVEAHGEQLVQSLKIVR